MTAPAAAGLLLALPDGWTASDEINDGQTVRVLRPPAPLPGVLRVLTDRIAADPPGDAAAVAVKLREVAVRFVRPDDPRAGDRLIEDGPHGSISASAVLLAEGDSGDGQPETHYLWLRAEPLPGRAMIRAAMAALAVPGDRDGSPDAIGVVGAADVMLMSATFVAAD